MEKVKITCPSCQKEFQTEKADLYECLHCGTNIRPKTASDEAEDLDKTQIIKV